MAPPLLFLKDIRLTFGGTPLLDGAELSIGPFERLCLVGRNGSGKSTLLKIAAGMIEPDAGTRFVQPSVTIRYLPQSPDLSGFATTAAFVEAGLAPGDDPHRARYLLESLGLTGAEDPAHLSGGESRRAALARVLAPEPDILLLDEPTNHLDVVAIEGLEAVLKATRSAMVLISHDRRFLENLSAGHRLARSRHHAAARQGLRRLRGVARCDPRGRGDCPPQARPPHRAGGALAPLRRERQAEAQSAPPRGADRASRRAQASAGQSPVCGDVKLTVQEARETGKKVIEARRIAKSYGDLTLVRDFSIKIARGDRIGIVGPNGAGKTTLINLLTGALPPDAGSVQLGTNLEIATLDQRRESLDPEASVATTLTGGSGDQVIIDGESRHVIGYMKDFLFKPEQARTPVKALSGGERGRLLLARALAQPSNLMVLDEPTNDLDLETLDLLQEMLASYPGTLILVSHDRDFLDRTVTSVIAFEGEGKLDRICGRLFRHGGATRGWHGRVAAQ